MAARTWIGALVLASAFGSFACSGDCTNPADCEQGFICENKKCVMRGAPPPPPPAPDVGFPPPDSGLHPDADGGVPERDGGDGGDASDASDAGDAGDVGDAEAGVPDVGDAGFFMGVDVGGGPGDVGNRNNQGTIAIAELRTGAGTYADEASADFVDYSGVTYSTLENTYQVSAMSRCTVTERRQIGVTSPAGFTAAEVRIVASQNSHNPPVVLTQSSPGVYRTSAMLTRGIFTPNGVVQFQIVAGMGAGSLAALMAMVASPADFGALTPALGTSLQLSRSLAFTWQRNTASAAQKVVIEMYDLLREVVMRCEVADTGSFTVPEQARATFLSRGPRAPVFVELRFDETTTRDVAITGGGVLPVTLRASSGVRYTTRQ